MTFSFLSPHAPSQPLHLAEFLIPFAFVGEKKKPLSKAKKKKKRRSPFWPLHPPPGRRIPRPGMHAHRRPCVGTSLWSRGQGRKAARMTAPVPSRVGHPSPALTDLESFSSNLPLLVPLFTPNNPRQLTWRAPGRVSGTAGPSTGSLTSP